VVTLLPGYVDTPLTRAAIEPGLTSGLRHLERKRLPKEPFVDT
jgi:hypothetical protein